MKVEVKVTPEAGELRRSPHGRPLPCWKISISDHGRGIPDSQKPGCSRGALVTDRYGGKAEVRNIVEGEYTKGTTFEIWLPR